VAFTIKERDEKKTIQMQQRREAEQREKRLDYERGGLKKKKIRAGPGLKG